MKLRSPIQVQLSPETQQACSSLAKGISRSLLTLGLKVRSARTTFITTTLDSQVKPDYTGTVFVDC